MLTTGLLKVITLLLLIPIGNLASNSESVSYELLREPKGCFEELARSVSSLDWIIRLIQWRALLCSKLWPDYNRALAYLEACKIHTGDEECIIKIVNGLFNNIMKSNFTTDKVKALQAVDPFLNDETAKYLIKKYSNSFNSLSTTIKFLVVGRVRAVEKNADNARNLLKVKYKRDLTDILAIDVSIWFLLNQQVFHFDPLETFYWPKDRWILISEISKHQIIIRADVDLEILCKSMEADYKKYDNNDLVSQWYHHLVKDIKLYDTRNGWELIGNSLLLKDSKLITDILDATLSLNTDGKRNYLLLSHENPVKQLIELKPTNLGELYSCFSLGLNIGSFDYLHGIFQKISREKHAELASCFFKLQKKSNLSAEFIDLQQRLPYLDVALLLENNDINLNMDYSRKFVQIPKTLELLDVIGRALIEGVQFYGTPFSWYLSENNIWGKATEEHFHYYISALALENYRVLTRGFTEYFGTGIKVDNQEAPLVVLRACISRHVDCTLDKIPRHLNAFFEIIDELDLQGIDSSKRLDFAIRISIFNDETAGSAYQRDFVYYMLEGELAYFIKSPVFVDFIRMRHKHLDRKIEEIKHFLYFERLVHSYFPSLVRMNLEKSLESLSIKSNFSIILEKFVTSNFNLYVFPFALSGLKKLERELLKYNPEIAMWLKLERIPIKALVKAIYETLNAPCTDLRFALIRHLFNAQLLHAGLV